MRRHPSYHSRFLSLTSALMLLLTAGCVGTDFITSPTTTMTDQGGATPAFGNRAGMFTKRPGVSYDVRGNATLEEETPGAPLVLRFSNDFAVSNGPGIDVFLSTGNTVTGSSLNLGDVKRLTGAQSYDVPAGVGLNDYNWVIIHCVPFNATFGYAELE